MTDQNFGNVKTLINIARREINMESEEISEESEENNFTEVARKKRKIQSFEKVFEKSNENQTENINLQNRFAPLQDKNSDENTTGNATPINTKPRMPPPVVIHQKVNDHKELIALITEMIGKQFHLKYTAGRTIIQAYTINNYRILMKELTDQKIHLHTYTPKDEKTHGFVLRGLDSAPDTQEIKEELENTHKIPVKQIYKMNTKYRPLYLIITEKDINLKFLQSTIKYVCCTSIKWEIHTKSKLISQCRRCQEWGHATTNCFAPPKCANCANPHWTYQCTTKEKKICANCGGQDHKAYSTECSKYKQRLSQIRKNETPVAAYKEAPIPTTNPWKERTPHINNELLENNEENFPPLSETRRPQTTTHNPQQSYTLNTQQTPTFQNLQTLTQEFNTLNELINVDKMIKLIQNLNTKLTQARNNTEKFLIFHSFTSNLSESDF